MYRSRNQRLGNAGRALSKNLTRSALKPDFVLRTRAASKDLRLSREERIPYLFIDEAHHVEAPTWRKFKERFHERQVVQFTATPFREDNQPLDGDIVCRYPLLRAQREGYFRPIRFESVLAFDPTHAYLDGIPDAESCERIYHSINAESRTMIVVTAKQTFLDWADSDSVFEWQRDLYIMIWSRDRNLLYINGSSNASDYKGLVVHRLSHLKPFGCSGVGLRQPFRRGIRDASWISTGRRHPCPLASSPASIWTRTLHLLRHELQYF